MIFNSEEDFKLCINYMFKKKLWTRKMTWFFDQSAEPFLLRGEVCPQPRK